MKKVLLASSALMMVAGAAMADVKISGTGRAGLVYDNNVAATASKTTVGYRLRFNVDASKETDAGVTFGGRIRFQDAGGSGAAKFSAAYLYAESGGFRVEVGNANTAYDAGALIYNSEIGFTDSSVGDPIFDFYSFSSGGYTGTPNRVGVYASYAFQNGTVRASYVNPDQTLKTLPVGTSAEWGVSADYKFDKITVAAGYVDNQGGVSNLTQWNLAAEYAINDASNVGLIYFNYDNSVVVGENDSRFTLYGNTKLANGVTLAGYVTNDDNSTNVKKTGLGIGASYDLGGATIAGAVHRTFANKTYADLGIKFSF